jgi:hypothetical protein
VHQILLENEHSTVRPKRRLLDLAEVSGIRPEVKTVRCYGASLADKVRSVVSVGGIPLLVNERSEGIPQYSLLKNQLQTSRGLQCDATRYGEIILHTLDYFFGSTTTHLPSSLDWRTLELE